VGCNSPGFASSLGIHESQYAPSIGFADGGVATFSAMQGARDPKGIMLEQLVEFPEGDIVRRKEGDVAIVPIEPHY
jgi:hypothetical protein